MRLVEYLADHKIQHVSLPHVFVKVPGYTCTRSASISIDIPRNHAAGLQVVQLLPEAIVHPYPDPDASAKVDDEVCWVASFSPWNQITPRMGCS